MSAVAHATHTPDGHHEAHPEVGFLKKYVFSTDHKIIGIQFLFLGLMFMVVGGLLAMLIRWQLAWPDEFVQRTKHPVPILSRTLWSTIAPNEKLGAIASVDTAARTVTLHSVGTYDTRPGDEVT